MDKFNPKTDRIDEAYKKITSLNEDKDRKDRMEMLDLAINYLTQAKKQIVKNNIDMANKNVKYALEKMQGKFWKDLFKEMKELDEATPYSGQHIPHASKINHIVKIYDGKYKVVQSPSTKSFYVMGMTKGGEWVPVTTPFADKNMAVDYKAKLDKAEADQKKMLKTITSSMTEAVDWKEFYKMAKDTSGKDLKKFEKKYGGYKFQVPHIMDALKKSDTFEDFMRKIKKHEK